MTAVLIIGCGDVGSRVARHWRQRGHPVRALVRSAARTAALRAAGVGVTQVDLDGAGPLPALPAAGALVYYFAPPPAQGDGDPRLARVLDHLDGRPARMVYISTSGVYGDRHGEWVTEDTPVSPASARARRRWAAEQLLERMSEDGGTPLWRLRVPAIYGPGRLPVERLERGEPVVRPSEAPFTNRIHIDDLARVCIAFTEADASPGVYNVSDGDPTTMTDYFNRVADALGLPRPPAVSLAAARERMSPAMYSFWCESRRLDNRRLLRALDITLNYPTLEAGLAACVPPAGR